MWLIRFHSQSVLSDGLYSMGKQSFPVLYDSRVIRDFRFEDAVVHDHPLRVVGAGVRLLVLTEAPTAQE